MIYNNVGIYPRKMNLPLDSCNLRYVIVSHDLNSETKVCSRVYDSYGRAESEAREKHYPAGQFFEIQSTFAHQTPDAIAKGREPHNRNCACGPCTAKKIREYVEDLRNQPFTIG